MKLSLAPALLVAFSGLLGSLALPGTGTPAVLLDGPSDGSVPALPFSWPAYAVAGSKEVLETNAERFRRGLGPKPPTKLYDRSRRKALHPRISPPPATGTSSTGHTSSFQYCQATSGGAIYSTTPLTDTDVQSAVNDCATKQYSSCRYATCAYSVGYTGSAFTCTINVAYPQTSTVPCNTTNFGVYY